jgi:hypothetical protein
MKKVTQPSHVQQSPFGALDPQVYSSDLDEFTPTPIPEVTKAAFPGPEMTMRERKRRPMQLAGQQVPLVRCMMHDPVLNLSIGGKIYETQMSWELSFTNEAGLKTFYPH